MGRFIGHLNFEGENPYATEVERSSRKLEEAFGIIVGTHLVIACKGGRPNGASIPRIFQLFLGDPFSRTNRYWMTHHDAGYNRFAVVIDLAHRAFEDTTPEQVFDWWKRDTAGGIPVSAFIPSATLPRIYWDKRVLLAAMAEMREPGWKKRVVYRGVRLGGWASFRKHFRS